VVEHDIRVIRIVSDPDVTKGDIRCRVTRHRMPPFVTSGESCRTSSSNVAKEFEKLVYGVIHSPEMRSKRTLLILNRTFFSTIFFCDNR
jgi:hypothetical protein